MPRSLARTQGIVHKLAATCGQSRPRPAMTIAAMETEDRTALELLAFYRDAGVDSLLGEEAIDRFADDRPAFAVPERGASSSEAARAGVSGHATRAQDDPSPPMSRDGVSRTAMSPPPSAEAAVMSARVAAKSAESLDALRALLATFEGCMLRTTATQLVFADGNPKGRVMFVGEAPGRDEDIAGVPFVGRSGKLLDLMMQAIGLDRTQAYIANIVPWRPPGNRTPTPHESAICLPFLLRQIELADPDILVCLGQPSTQTLLGTKEGITRTRGRWFKFHSGRREIRALATYHPAFLLRSPLQKRLAWRDFLALKKALAS
jgi:uracil-DNA glycosylase